MVNFPCCGSYMGWSHVQGNTENIDQTIYLSEILKGDYLIQMGNI